MLQSYLINRAREPEDDEEEGRRLADRSQISLQATRVPPEAISRPRYRASDDVWPHPGGQDGADPRHRSAVDSDHPTIVVAAESVPSALSRTGLLAHSLGDGHLSQRIHLPLLRNELLF